MYIHRDRQSPDRRDDIISRYLVANLHGQEVDCTGFLFQRPMIVTPVEHLPGALTSIGASGSDLVGLYQDQSPVLL